MTAPRFRELQNQVNGEVKTAHPVYNKTAGEMNGRGDGEDDKGLIWKLPAVKSKYLGKLGPAFGFGAGCGAGFGLGLMGGKQFFCSLLPKLLFPLSVVSTVFRADTKKGNNIMVRIYDWDLGIKIFEESGFIAYDCVK